MVLLVLRHAKAEKDSQTGRDEDRPLSEVGRRQAEYIAKRLAYPKMKGVTAPAMILSSEAVRARMTAEIVAAAVGVAVEFDEALALGSDTRDALDLVRRLAAAERTALIVGHNPQLEELAASLAHNDDRLRTGEMVAFEVTLEGRRVAAVGVGSMRMEGE